jgi:hypothetical protein
MIARSLAHSAHGDGQAQTRSTAEHVGGDDRLPTAASHSFYTRLNQLFREHGFGDFAEAQCAMFYPETIGRPGLPPGIYFRLLQTQT